MSAPKARVRGRARRASRAKGRPVAARARRRGGAAISACGFLRALFRRLPQLVAAAARGFLRWLRRSLARWIGRAAAAPPPARGGPRRRRVVRVAVTPA